MKAALDAALAADEEAGFQAYLALLHPDRRSTDKAITQLRRYSWKRFRRQARDYVLPGTDRHFVVSRQDPSRLDESTTHVRLFIDPAAREGRTHPTPIRLERKPGGPWLITSNSL